MKQTIAIDIDDVMANENHAMMRFINKRYGLSHTEKDYDITGEYWGYWEKVWNVDEHEGSKRYDAFVNAKASKQVKLALLPGALETISDLKQRYNLVVVTSRKSVLLQMTEEWLEEHFPKTFNGVHFIELWGSGEKLSKARICKEIGASYLIDDNVEHCSLAQEAGVQALLFGDYGWNRVITVPHGVVRVRNWQEVKRYFDDQAL